MKAWPCRDTKQAHTPIWQLCLFPAEPVYWRATPHEALPCFKKPVSSMTRTASSSPSVSSAYSRTTSRSASASHYPRPRIACWRQGPGSPAASARIQPVLRGSLPNSPSRNCPTEAATRSCVNSRRMRCLASRNDEAHSVSVSSTDAPPISEQQFARLAVTMSKSAVLPTGKTPLEIITGSMMNRYTDLLRRVSPEPNELAFLHEASNRLDEAIEQHFG